MTEKVVLIVETGEYTVDGRTVPVSQLTEAQKTVAVKQHLLLNEQTVVNGELLI